MIFHVIFRNFASFSQSYHSGYIFSSCSFLPFSLLSLMHHGTEPPCPPPSSCREQRRPDPTFSASSASLPRHERARLLLLTSSSPKRLVHELALVPADGHDQQQLSLAPREHHRPLLGPTGSEAPFPFAGVPFRILSPEPHPR